MKDVRSTVEKILQTNLHSRDSDKELFLEFMYQHGIRLDEFQAESFYKMPSLESARRERQKFQEKGLYPATKAVKKNRSRMEQEIGQRIPTTKPEDIRYLLDPVEAKDFHRSDSYQAPLFDIRPERTD